MSVVGGSLRGEKVELVRKEDLPRSRALLLRDSLIALCEAHLTQETVGLIFNRHPEHIGRVVRQMDDDQRDRAQEIVGGILSG
jgi:putative AlgH/UPF0301 family transcriptional regulator